MIRIGLAFYPTIPPGIIHPEQAYFIPLKTLGSVLPGLTGFSFLFPPLMMISKKAGSVSIPPFNGLAVFLSELFAPLAFHHQVVTSITSQSLIERTL